MGIEGDLRRSLFRSPSGAGQSAFGIFIRSTAERGFTPHAMICSHAYNYITNSKNVKCLSEISVSRFRMLLSDSPRGHRHSHCT